jgi:general stress protein YciG
MPTKKGEPRGSESPSIKDPELYEKLLEDGASKQKAARISNAAAKRGRSSVGRKGGQAGDYEDWTVPQLKERAKEIGLKGYSAKKKSELISALRNS